MMKKLILGGFALCACALLVGCSSGDQVSEAKYKENFNGNTKNRPDLGTLMANGAAHNPSPTNLKDLPKGK
jgi:hypothetical protein